MWYIYSSHEFGQRWKKKNDCKNQIKAKWRNSSASGYTPFRLEPLAATPLWPACHHCLTQNDSTVRRCNSCYLDNTPARLLGIAINYSSNLKQHHACPKQRNNMMKKIWRMNKLKISPQCIHSIIHLMDPFAEARFFNLRVAVSSPIKRTTLYFCRFYWNILHYSHCQLSGSIFITHSHQWPQTSQRTCIVLWPANNG